LAGPVRLLIVSDIRLHLECFADSLAAFDRITVVGRAANPAEALQLAKAMQPEVILIDVATEYCLDIVRTLNREVDTKILACGVHDVETEVLSCAEAGVTGCFPSYGSVAELAATIIGTRHDEVVCSPRAATALFRRVAHLARKVSDQPEGLPLTDRETEVLALIERGLSNKEIARQLYIEVATVKNHVHNILHKLQVTSREQAAKVVRVGAVYDFGRMTTRPSPSIRS
jgi:DNA-binding NarL/FixJ family response regulator